VISRRALLANAPLLAAGGLAVWLMRDRIPWPPPRVTFAKGDRTAWIPLPERGGLIEIPGQIGGRDIRVVVDSGAQFSAIDRALAEALQLTRTATLPLMAYGVSGEPSLTHTVKLDLALPGLSIAGMRAAALDLAHLSRVTGRGFSLLLGRDVLRELVADVDFPLRRVAFKARDGFAPPRDARLAPLKLVGGAPMTPVRIEGGPPVDVMVDTGATGLLALSAQTAQTAGLLGPDRETRSAHSVSLGGLSLDRVVIARRVEIAGISLTNVGVQIYEPSARAAVPAGLLGTGFLRRFRMALDLGGGRLLLAPSTPMLVRGTR
jgi:predicted aspartyl protease